jgi:hypothetical protein
MKRLSKANITDAMNQNILTNFYFGILEKIKIILTRNKLCLFNWKTCTQLMLKTYLNVWATGNFPLFKNRKSNANCRLRVNIK